LILELGYLILELGYVCSEGVEIDFLLVSLLQERRGEEREEREEREGGTTQQRG